MIECGDETSCHLPLGSNRLEGSSSSINSLTSGISLWLNWFLELIRDSYLKRSETDCNVNSRLVTKNPKMCNNRLETDIGMGMGKL